MAADAEPGQKRKLEPAGSDALLESDEALARRLHEELNALTRGSRRTTHGSVSSGGAGPRKAAKSSAGQDVKQAVARVRQQQQDDGGSGAAVGPADAAVKLETAGGSGSDRTRKPRGLARELALLVTDMVETHTKAVQGGPRKTRDGEAEQPAAADGCSAAVVAGAKHESSSSLSEQERLAIEQLHAAGAGVASGSDARPAAARIIAELQRAARTSDSGGGAAGDSCSTADTGSGKASSSGAEPDASGGGGSRARAEASSGGTGAARGGSGRIPKLPMVAFGKRWYRARVLREAGGRVLLEYQGQDHEGGPFWLPEGHARIWRGSYKGRDWRYLGDGAWEPKTGSNPPPRQQPHQQQQQQQQQQQNGTGTTQRGKPAARPGQSRLGRDTGGGSGCGAASDAAGTGADTDGGEVAAVVVPGRPVAGASRAAGSSKRSAATSGGVGVSGAVARSRHDTSSTDQEDDVDEMQPLQQEQQPQRQQQQQQQQQQQRRQRPKQQQQQQQQREEPGSGGEVLVEGSDSKRPERPLQQSEQQRPASAASLPRKQRASGGADNQGNVTLPAKLARKAGTTSRVPAAAEAGDGSGEPAAPVDEAVDTAAQAADDSAPPAAARKGRWVRKGGGPRTAAADAAAGSEGGADGDAAAARTVKRRGGPRSRPAGGTAPQSRSTSAAAAQSDSAGAAGLDAGGLLLAMPAGGAAAPNSTGQPGADATALEQEEASAGAAAAAADSAGLLVAGLTVDTGAALKQSSSSEGGAPASPTSPVAGGSPRHRRKGKPQRARLDSDDLNLPVRKGRGRGAGSRGGMAAGTRPYGADGLDLMFLQQQLQPLSADEPQPTTAAAGLDSRGAFDAAAATAAPRPLQQHNGQPPGGASSWRAPVPRKSMGMWQGGAGVSGPAQAQRTSNGGWVDEPYPAGDGDDVTAAAGAALGAAAPGAGSSWGATQQLTRVGSGGGLAGWSDVAPSPRPGAAGGRGMGRHRRGNNWSRPMQRPPRPPPGGSSAGSMGFAAAPPRAAVGAAAAAAAAALFESSGPGELSHFEPHPPALLRRQQQQHHHHHQHHHQQQQQQQLLLRRARGGSGGGQLHRNGRQLLVPPGTEGGVASLLLGRERASESVQQATLCALLDAVGEVQISSGRPDLLEPLRYGGLPLAAGCGPLGCGGALQPPHASLSAPAAALLAAVPSLGALQRMATLHGQTGIAAVLSGHTNGQASTLFE